MTESLGFHEWAFSSHAWTDDEGDLTAGSFVTGLFSSALAIVSSPLAITGCSGDATLEEDDNYPQCPNRDDLLDNRQNYGDYYCPVLNNFPPNQSIDYSNLDAFSDEGLQTCAGSRVSAFTADVFLKRWSYSDREYRFFRALNQNIHELGEIPQPKPPEVNAMIMHRSAEEILADFDSGERDYYSGCHDIAILARAALVAAGYEVVYVDSVHREYIESSVQRGHTFLEVRNPANDEIILYDPTAGIIHENYNPQNYNLPGGCLVFAKGLDPWSMGIFDVNELGICLQRFKDDIYNQAEGASFEEVRYKEVNL